MFLWLEVHFQICDALTFFFEPYPLPVLHVPTNLNLTPDIAKLARAPCYRLS